MTLRTRVVVVAVMISSALLVSTGCSDQSTQPSSEAEHVTPKPAEIVFLEAKASPVRLEDGTVSFDAAWSVLDALSEHDDTEPNAWPEDPAAVAEPVPVDQYVQSVTNRSPEDSGVDQIVFIFESGTWLTFPNDATASGLFGSGASKEQGVPFRAGRDGGTEYHVREVTVDWDNPASGVSALLRTEASSPVMGSLPTGAWLRTVGPGIRPALDAFVEIAD